MENDADDDDDDDDNEDDKVDGDDDEDGRDVQNTSLIKGQLAEWRRCLLEEQEEREDPRFLCKLMIYH